MPDIINHYRLADSVYEILDADLKTSLHRGLFDLASIGPDIWFSYRFWMPPLQKGKPARGGVMHRCDTGAFLEALYNAALKYPEAKTEFFSYLSGFLCHYCLDRAAHPYIIYKSGEYLGTPETRHLRGNHCRVERALDLREMKRWGVTLGENPMNRKVLRLRKIPANMRVGLDEVFRFVYHWDNAWRDLNRSLKDQKRFYTLAADPSGKVDRIIRRIDHGQLGKDLTGYPYFGKEAAALDVANEAHAEWHHPFVPSDVHTDSFDDMFAAARSEAVDIINLAWDFLKKGKPVNGLFGNASYESNLECDSADNKRIPVCDPFVFSR